MKSANAPSCLVAYGADNVDAIRMAVEHGRIESKLVVLKP